MTACDFDIICIVWRNIVSLKYPQNTTNPEIRIEKRFSGIVYYSVYLFFLLTVLTTNKIKYVTTPMPSGYKM